MPEVDRYNILVLGSGESGKYLAWTMAAAGHRTAVVERKLIGGSCPNVACLPSKNIIHSAKVKSLASRASAFGVETGAIRTDMNAVQERKRRMVADLIKVDADRYENAGVDLIMGSARFVAPRTIAVHHDDVDARMVAGDRVFINVGTRAAIPDVPFEGARRGLHGMRTKQGHIDRIEWSSQLSGELTGEQRPRLLEIAQRCRVHRTLVSEIDIRLPQTWLDERDSDRPEVGAT